MCLCAQLMAIDGNGFGLPEPFSKVPRSPSVVTVCALSAPQMLHPLGAREAVIGSPSSGDHALTRCRPRRRPMSVAGGAVSADVFDDAVGDGVGSEGDLSIDDLRPACVCVCKRRESPDLLVEFGDASKSPDVSEPRLP